MLLKLIRIYQKLVVTAFSIFSVKTGNKICIGTTEIANNLFFYKDLFKNDCITVAKKGNRYYDYVPDVRFPLWKRHGLFLSLTVYFYLLFYEVRYFLLYLGWNNS